MGVSAKRLHPAPSSCRSLILGVPWAGSSALWMWGGRVCLAQLTMLAVLCLLSLLSASPPCSGILLLQSLIFGRRQLPAASRAWWSWLRGLGPGLGPWLGRLLFPAYLTE